MNEQRPIYQITTTGGIRRDGTTLDGNWYTDGQWVRFYRGKPKKMGGYRETSAQLPSQSRGIFTFSKNNNNYIYSFASDKISLLQCDINAVGAAYYDITPGTLVADNNYQWQTDSLYDASGGGKNVVLAHPATNLSDIANETMTNIWQATIGDASGTAFAKISDGSGGYVTASGGVVVLQPFVFAYGHNGLIRNSNENTPNDWTTGVGKAANSANVASSKIVKGLPMRGGGNSPAGVFWSLTDVIRVSWAGSTFRYDNITSQSSVLSSNGIVEFDGVYFWAGIDRFLMFDGSKVRELPNQMNLNWFYDNMNWAQRQKVWATKVPRFGEIWWFYPRGTATECTHAVIYNVRENSWYDIELARGAGTFSQAFRFPIWAANSANSSNAYSVFAHEIGRDNAIADGRELAIPSWFETSDFGFPTGGADSEKPTGQDYWTRLTRVEPDFVMEGDMKLTVRGEEFAQNPTKVSAEYTFNKNTGKIDMREQRREIRLRFESNTIGGDYEMGRVVLHVEPGDIRS